MTRYALEESSCAACGHRQEVSVLMSTNSFSPPSLEGRPGGQASMAVVQAIQECANCGYCSTKISALPGDIEPSSVTRRTISLPKPWSERWRAWSEVAQSAGALAQAGWASLHGAWAAESEGSLEAVRSLRLRAADLFRECRARQVNYGETRAFEITVAADVLRRAGEFESARAVLAEQGPDETRESAFIRDRSEAEDARSYTVEDAANFEREGSGWRPPILGIIITRRGRIRSATFASAALLVVLFENPTLLWLGLVGLGACFLDMLLVTLTHHAP